MILFFHCFWFALLSSLLVFARRGGTEGEEDTETAAVNPTSTSTNGSLISAATAVSSNDSPSDAIPTPIILPIVLLPPANATSCMPVSLKWNVDTAQMNNSDIHMMLSITNRGVAQSNSSSGHSPHIIITETITNSTPISQGSLYWSAVTVPSGWYVLQACPSYSKQDSMQQSSSPFFVHTNTNMSCIELSMHAPLSPAALAGTVVGALAGVTALVGAFFLPRIWRRGVPEHQAWKDKSKGLYHVF